MLEGARDEMRGRETVTDTGTVPILCECVHPLHTRALEESFEASELRVMGTGEPIDRERPKRCIDLSESRRGDAKIIHVSNLQQVVCLDILLPRKHSGQRSTLCSRHTAKISKQSCCRCSPERGEGTDEISPG
jgi:hypothetical protein